MAAAKCDSAKPSVIPLKDEAQLKEIARTAITEGYLVEIESSDQQNV
jgi:hypothetical protein